MGEKWSEGVNDYDVRGGKMTKYRFMVQSDLRLREFLNNMPGGYPETESGVELRILEKFFTPERGVI